MDVPTFGKLISISHRSYGFAFTAAQEGWKVTSILLCWISLLQGTCNTWEILKVRRTELLSMPSDAAAACTQTTALLGKQQQHSQWPRVDWALLCTIASICTKWWHDSNKWPLLQQKKNYELEWDTDCLCKKIQYSLRRVCLLPFDFPNVNEPNKFWPKPEHPVSDKRRNCSPKWLTAPD